MDDLEEPKEETTRIHIGVRVMIYGMLCTLLVSVALTACMGWLAWSSMSRATENAERLLHVRQDIIRCRTAVTAAQAKLELVEKWVMGNKRVRTPPTAQGGTTK